MALPDIIVTNIHKRYTGVSATVAALVPIQQETKDIGVLDTGGLGLENAVHVSQIILGGWRKPEGKRYRVWHARRDVEMLLGLFLKYVLFQRWKLVFTSAAPKRHGGVLRSIINRMDYIISTSPRAAAYLDWHSKVITHGVDSKRFIPASDKSALRVQLDLPAQYSIGVFGRIRPSKGTDLFVDAMIAVLPEFPAFSAFITGECKDGQADYLTEMTGKIAAAGLQDRIVFTGDLTSETVLKMYQASDLCVAASRTEGFGLTPMEAMACGVPVLTSHAGYWPQLVKDGQNGYLFETDNLADMVAKLRILLADPQKLTEIGAFGREFIEREHSILHEAAQINAVYTSLQ